MALNELHIARRDYCSVAPFVVVIDPGPNLVGPIVMAVATTLREAVVAWFRLGRHAPSATFDGSGPLRRYVMDSTGTTVLVAQHMESCRYPLDSFACTEEASVAMASATFDDAGREGVEMMELAAIARDTYLDFVDRPSHGH